MIPYASPSIDDSDRSAVDDVLRTTQLTQGPKVQEFEEAICEYTGARYCVAMSNCTAALMFIGRHFAMIKMDKCVLPAITFFATLIGAKCSGHRIAIADIDLETFNAENCHLGVELAGRPLKRQCMAIDSAHSLNRNMDMSICVVRTLSFHAIKNITTMGEGGAILSDDESTVNIARSWREYGKSGGVLGIGAGFNFRMTCAQAAMGISQLKRADLFKERKEEIVWRYNAAFAGVDEIITPKPEDGVFWHLYIIRTAHRDELKAYLAEQQIQTQLNYIPLYMHPGMACDTPLPNAEEYYRTALSLPLYVDLDNETQDYVINCVKEFYRDSA